MSDNKLGTYLKELRKKQHYTQDYVASHLNIIRQSYSHYETGRTTPNVETLNKLASLYQISLDSLLNLQLDNTIDSPKIVSEVITYTRDSSSADNELSANEQQLIRLYKQLDSDEQLDILDFIQKRADRNSSKKEQ